MSLFRVYVNTGFVHPYTKIVEAFSELGAFDTVADYLEEKGSAFVMTYDEILSKRNVGQSAEGYIAAHSLVRCGNHGVYLAPGGVIKLPFTDYGEAAYKAACEIKGEDLIAWTKESAHNMAARFLLENQENAFSLIEDIMSSERLRKVEAYIGNGFELEDVLEELYLMFEDEAIPKISFKIPVVWEMCGTVTVEAKNLKEAIEIVRNDNDDIPLPKGNYVDGSFQLSTDDEEIIATYQKN